MQYFLTFNPKTREVLVPIKSTKWNAPRNSVQIETLPGKEGFAVVVNDKLTATEYIVDQRGETIYNTTDFTQSKVIDELGEIENGWTLDKPTTEFDTWVGDGWVTDTQAKFEANMLSVDSTRRSFYSSMSDPLISEATIERLQGNENKAIELENQAIAAREKIRAENPWPTKD